MTQSQDVVWDAITDSAKRRFDYESFVAFFQDLAIEHVAENILLLIIVGYAQGDRKGMIGARVKAKLLSIGMGSALEDLLENKETELKIEIRAAGTAISLFEMGLETPGVLAQVRSILQTD